MLIRKKTRNEKMDNLSRSSPIKEDWIFEQ